MTPTKRLSVVACMAAAIPALPAQSASLHLALPDALVEALTSGAALPDIDATAPREPLERLAGPAYADGVAAFAGPNRPDPRTLSNVLSTENNRKSDVVPFSNLGVAFFQLIASHEIAHTLTNEAPQEPAPIDLAPDDPLFEAGTYEQIPFDRSNFDTATGTGPGNPREQVNQITKEFDASTVYGSTAAREAELRDDTTPYLLKVGAGGDLPLNAAGRPIAGDGRADENTVLQALHALFVREHNRIATDIAASCKPGCTDQEVYDGTKILVSRMQHKIFYDEIVPTFLGTDDLTSLIPDGGPSPADFDPAIFQSFPAAAARLGHTQVPDTIQTGAPGGPITSTPLKECFFAAFTGTGCVDGIPEAEKLFGAAQQPAEPIDTDVVDGLRNAQVPGPTAGFVIDLKATNILRGRDHGLPDYLTMRQALGFGPSALDALLPEAVIDAYGDSVLTDGVDLLVGLFSEFRDPGSYLGPTGKALWAFQLENIRDLVFTFPDASSAMPFGMSANDAQALLDEWLDGVSMAGLLSRDTGYDISVWGASPFLVDPLPVPTPPALAAIVGGLVALGMVRRRRDRT